MWNPTPGWQPASSFQQPVVPPDAEPDDTPAVSVCFAQAWLPYVIGALMQLIQPTTWDTTDPTVLQTALERATALQEMFGTAEGCMQIRWHDGNCSLQISTDNGATWTNVSGWPDPGPPDCLHPMLRIDVGGNLQITYDGGTTWTTIDGWPPHTPPNPGGTGVDQFACNIATHLAQDIIQGALVSAISSFDSSLSAGLAVSSLVAIIPGLGPEYALAIDAAVGIVYLIYNTGSIGDYRTASTSAVLAHDLQCAIYNAIKADGMVTAANYAAVVAAIAAIMYSPSDVQTAINDFITSLGLNGLLAAQRAGGIVAGDCSLCTASSVAIAFHQSGSGLATLASDVGLGSGDWTIGFWAQRRPGGLGDVDGGIYQSGNALSPSGAYASIEHDGLFTGNMGVNCSDGVSGDNLQLGVAFSGGQVHQLVYTRSGTTVSQYEDGTFGGNATFPSGSYTDGTPHTYFGHAFWNWGGGGTARYLDGMLWGIAIYVGTALTLTQIAAWYAHGGGAPPITPTHFWPCTEGVGSTLHDTVGGDDATLSGVTSWEVHS